MQDKFEVMDDGLDGILEMMIERLPEIQGRKIECVGGVLRVRADVGDFRVWAEMVLAQIKGFGWLSTTRLLRAFRNTQDDPRILT